MLIRWPNYYSQDWLKDVTAEHCAYALEVYEGEKALAKVALNREVFHHPEGRDIALIHLQDDEASSLKLLSDLGVEALTLRDPERLYEKGEELLFSGFTVSEPNATDQATFTSKNEIESVDEDTRVLIPYEAKGNLAFHVPDRFFATTREPLPEGLCGAPVLDNKSAACGMVEGIIPVTHKNEKLAGTAAFVPSFMIQAFVDYVERGLLEQIMPADLFKMVVTAKETGVVGGPADPDTEDSKTDVESIEKAYDKVLNSLRERYTPEQFKEIQKVIDFQADEVARIMDEEGGDLNEAVNRVQQKTLEVREMVMDQYRKQLEEGDSDEPATSSR